MKARVRTFRDPKDEARFWETHDSTDFLADLEADEETVFVRPEMGLIEVRPAVWRRLVEEARRRRTTPQRLVQRWLQERLAAAR